VIRTLASAALWPANFGCASDPGDGGVSRGSASRPTPDAPLTPTSDFYVNTNFRTPTVPRSWRLHLDGLVAEPVALSLADLKALPQVTRAVTLECIGNWPGGNLISSAEFTGPTLRDVLAVAGISERARGIRVLGLDGYPAYLPIGLAEADDAQIVHAINGVPLPLDHGPPVRALNPGRYGMFSVKWLDSITLTREYATYGSLSELVNFVDGETRPRSRVDTLWDGAELALGQPVSVAGLAITDGAGVARVEVDTGSGWEEAAITFNRLDDEHSPFLWTLWERQWTPDRVGEHVVRVRCVDTDGRTQDAEADFPYDSSAIHRVRVRVVG
jgi:DMSO/TMAO reductase YedYZ molybdopterin-dependent catalytic subunit